MTTDDRKFLVDIFENQTFVKLFVELMNEIRVDMIDYCRIQVRQGNLIEAARAEATTCFCEDFFSVVNGRLTQPGQQSLAKPQTE